MARSMWGTRKTKKWIKENQEAIKNMEWSSPQIREPKENEVKAWTVAVPNLAVPWQNTKEEVEDTLKFVRYVESLEGYLGLYPNPPHGTLLIFKSLNCAKRGKNLIQAFGVHVGTNICELYIDKRYAEKKE